MYKIIFLPELHDATNANTIAVRGIELTVFEDTTDSVKVLFANF